MNDLIPTSQTEEGNIIVGGRDLHEFLEIKTTYAKWINRMLEYGFTENSDYQRVTQICPTPGGLQEISDVLMTLDMGKEISMLQRSDKGKEARQYFLNLEKMWNSPEMVMKRAMDHLNKRIDEMKNEIEVSKPKVLFANAVETSESSCLIGELSKILKQNGVDIGQNRLFKWMRDEGYLIKKNGDSFNLPTQKSMELKLFEITKRNVQNPDGTVRVTRTTKVTGKGQVYFVNKFLNK